MKKVYFNNVEIGFINEKDEVVLTCPISMILKMYEPGEFEVRDE